MIKGGEPVQTIEVESIERLSVKPGETLVVKLPDFCESKVAEEIKDEVVRRLPDGVNILVTIGDVDFTVVGVDE